MKIRDRVKLLDFYGSPMYGTVVELCAPGLGADFVVRSDPEFCGDRDYDDGLRYYKMSDIGKRIFIL